MAYGGKNTRSSIADQITAEIESDMTSSASATKGRGFSLGQRITADTQSEVAKLKSDADKGSKAGVIRSRKDKEGDDLIPEKEEVAYFPAVEVNPKVISGQLEEPSSATSSLMAKPISTKDFSKQVSGLVKASGDDEFPEAVEMFAEKFDITPNEVYAVINGENKDSAYNKTNKGVYFR